MSVATHVPQSLVVDFNHVDGAQFVAEPFAVLDNLASRGPLWFSQDFDGFWIVTDPEMIKEMLLDPELFSSRQVVIPRFPGPLLVPGEMDPPEHSKYRRFLISWLTPKAVERFTPVLEQVFGELLDEVEGLTEFDFKARFAQPLPARVFTRILGLPEDECQQLERWIHQFTVGKTREDKVEGVTAMRAFMRREMENRRGSTSDDLLSLIATAVIDDAPIDIQMAENAAFYITLAGLDTTSGLVATIWHYLAEHPEYRRGLTESPASIARNMDEITRVFTTANITRIVTRDTAWHDYDLREGDQVYVAISAANRTFGHEPILNRESPPPLSLTFGQGHHRCLGLNLVRNEVAVALRMFHERYPNYELADETVEYIGGPLFAPKELRLRVLPA